MILMFMPDSQSAAVKVPITAVDFCCYDCCCALQVQYKYGVDSYNLLKESGADITFKTYNGMAHSVSTALCTPLRIIHDSSIASLRVLAKYCCLALLCGGRITWCRALLTASNAL